MFRGDSSLQHFDLTVQKWMPELFSGKREWVADKFGVAVATLLSKDSLRMDWKYYILDEKLRDTVLRAFTRQAMCKVSFVDGDAQLVCVERFDPRAIGDRGETSPMKGLLMSPFIDFASCDLARCTSVSQLPKGELKPRVAFVAPVLFSQSDDGGLSYLPKFTIPRTIKISLDELKRVAKVKCELTFRAGNDDEKDDSNRH